MSANDPTRKFRLERSGYLTGIPRRARVSTLSGKMGPVCIRMAVCEPIPNLCSNRTSEVCRSRIWFWPKEESSSGSSLRGDIHESVTRIGGNCVAVWKGSRPRRVARSDRNTALLLHDLENLLGHADAASFLQPLKPWRRICLADAIAVHVEQNIDACHIQIQSPSNTHRKPDEEIGHCEGCPVASK